MSISGIATASVDLSIGNTMYNTSVAVAKKSMDTQEVIDQNMIDALNNLPSAGKTLNVMI